MPCAHPIVYDALIVGSGASGSWVAKQLTEQGMRVLMLEAGPPRLPTCDFTEHVRPYQIKYRGFGNRQALIERQPIQRLCYACDEFSHQFFVDDHENPYTFPVDKPFMWIRGRQVGGKTFCWARESYRYSDYEFKAASRTPHAHERRRRQPRVDERGGQGGGCLLPRAHDACAPRGTCQNRSAGRQRARIHTHSAELANRALPRGARQFFRPARPLPD